MENTSLDGVDRALSRSVPSAVDVDLKNEGEESLADKKQLLFLSRLTNINAVVIRKIMPGFPRACVQNLDKVFRQIETGALGAVKFVVIDFAHASEAAGSYGDGFEKLMGRVIDLVVASPVITIAWARGAIRGADLEFALRCSGLIADPAARFSFDCDAERIGGIYATLTRRLGFVQAERLLENGESLGAEAMRELCLVKDLVDTREGLAAIEAYLLHYARRYNGNLAILRAQRMTERGVAESWRHRPPRTVATPRWASKTKIEAVDERRR